METDKRSNIQAYVKWLNPYTNTEEEIDIYLPNECIDKNIQPYFKKEFDLDIGNIDKFKTFLETLDQGVSSLELFDDFIDLCVNDYLKTPYYNEDKATALDDYEFLHDLGEYAEEEDYIE